MNDEFKRGEVWYVDMSETQGVRLMGRPAVIISSDDLNDKGSQVTVVYMTTAGSKGYSCNVPIAGMRRDSWVKCNQLDIVEKKFLREYNTTLSDADMAVIESGIRKALDLRDAGGEVPETDTEIKVERDMYKRLYETCLDKLVGKKFTEDTARETPEMEPRSEPLELPVESEFPPLDLNSCGIDDLRRMGIPYDVAKRIIDTRPFATVDDLRKISGVTALMFGLVKKKLVVRSMPPVAKPVVEKKPVLPEKINVNTATTTEMLIFGLGENPAKGIRAYRNKWGSIAGIEELAKCSRCTKAWIEKWKDKVEF